MPDGVIVVATNQLPLKRVMYESSTISTFMGFVRNRLLLSRTGINAIKDTKECTDRTRNDGVVLAAIGSKVKFTNRMNLRISFTVTPSLHQDLVKMTKHRAVDNRAIQFGSISRDASKLMALSC